MHIVLNTTCSGFIVANIKRDRCINESTLGRMDRSSKLRTFMQYRFSQFAHLYIPSCVTQWIYNFFSLKKDSRITGHGIYISEGST